MGRKETRRLLRVVAPPIIELSRPRVTVPGSLLRRPQFDVRAPVTLARGSGGKMGLGRSRDSVT
jgi:hypothetical protein